MNLLELWSSTSVSVVHTGRLVIVVSSTSWPHSILSYSDFYASQRKVEANDNRKKRERNFLPKDKAAEVMKNICETYLSRAEMQGDIEQERLEAQLAELRRRQDVRRQVLQRDDVLILPSLFVSLMFQDAARDLRDDPQSTFAQPGVKGDPMSPEPMDTMDTQ